MRSSTWRLLVLLLAVGGACQARPQTAPQDDPVAVAARRARDQKKQQPKAAKVWDNDNIPKSPDGVSVVGQPAPEASPTQRDSSAPGGDGKTADSGTKNPAVTSADKRGGLEADLASAKEALLNLQNDVDIMQRKLVLDQQAYYSKPGYTSDKASAAVLNDEQTQIDAKQLEMGAAQNKIADLQAQLNALSDTKAATPPPPPQ
jgi:hypothetical protein